MSGFPDFAALDFDAVETPAAAPGPPGDPWLTPEGIAVEPLYTAADAEGLDFPLGWPGLAPFVRGPYPTMYRWDPLESTCRHASLSIL